MWQRELRRELAATPAEFRQAMDDERFTYRYDRWWLARDVPEPDKAPATYKYKLARNKEVIRKRCAASHTRNDSEPIGPLGIAMQRRRRQLGISQSQLGRSIRKRPATISNIERGARKPYVRTLIDIAASLRCRVSDLLRDDGLYRPPSKAGLHELGIELTRLREARGLTRYKAHTTVGTSWRGLRDAEAGAIENIELRRIEDLAGLYETPVHLVFDGAGQ
jgi:transcriptional regulator with XRE-family HTH domain